MNPNELDEHLHRVITEFKGDLPVLESAIGALFVGKRMGWKVLLLIHDKRTLKKYGEVLNLNFKDEMPDVGEYAHKSVAWRAVQKVSNFWKAVSGEITGVRTPKIK